MVARVDKVEESSLENLDSKTESGASSTGRTLKDLIDGFSEYGPQDAIVSFVKNGSVTLNYQGFLTEIRNVAAAMLSQGIKKGDNVVFFAPNSAAWIVSALATIYTGATVVPIDSQQNDDVLKHIL